MLGMPSFPLACWTILLSGFPGLFYSNEFSFCRVEPVSLFSGAYFALSRKSRMIF